MPVDHGRGTLVSIAVIVIIIAIGVGAMLFLGWILGG